MSSSGDHIQTVVVGDANVDVVLVPAPKRDGDRKWRKEKQFCEFRRPGGAWLVHEIVEAAIGRPDTVHTYPREQADEWCASVRPRCLTSVTALQAFSRNPEEKSKDKVYRMDREHALLGWVRPQGPDGGDDGDHRALLTELLKAMHDREEHKPGLLVVYDHNNGFREIDAGRSLAPFLDGNPHFAGEDAAPGLILWHPDFPLPVPGDGRKSQVWDFLSRRHAERTVVVVNAEDMREHGIFLKENLSLEQTAYDFLDQLSHSPLRDLTGLGYVAVRFTNAVMLYSRGLDGRPELLFLTFLTHAHRGGSSQSAEHGSVVGYTVLLVAALASGIHWAQTRARAASASREEWGRLLETGLRGGCELGLGYGQLLFRNGFLPEDFEDREISDPYPYRMLVEKFAGLVRDDPGYRKEVQLTSIPFDPRKVRDDRAWSRVSLLGTGEDLLREAEAIVFRGLSAVLEGQVEQIPGSPWEVLTERQRFPYFKVGEMMVVDRREVDALEGLSTLISNYLVRKDKKEPLSIAVFGPPGSGKSFAVKQLLTKASKGKEIKTLDFNMAQFNDLHDLAKAFHVVQDKGLGKDVPFVFFDEFDSSYGSEPLGWLKYFLAPMQDGKFRDGETTYRTGRAIFFFAGGTHSTFEKFCNPESQSKEALQQAKLPDFVSRLRGYLDIAGINARPRIPLDAARKGEGAADLARDAEVDDVTIIRRAILLRAFLEKNRDRLIDPVTDVANIDSQVVRAFLCTREFKHGVRSMEAIVDMAATSLSRSSFQKSSVPLDTQLQMHVDPEDFLLRYVPPPGQ